jgi:hypothetical protein
MLQHGEPVDRQNVTAPRLRAQRRASLATAETVDGGSGCNEHDLRLPSGTRIGGKDSKERAQVMREEHARVIDHYDSMTRAREAAERCSAAVALVRRE